MRSLTALKVLAVMAAFNVAILACGSDSDDGAGQTTSTSAGATTTTEATDGSTTSPPTSESTTTTEAATTTSLAGTPGAIGPGAGDQLAVVGVAFDDTLNIRQGPGTDQPVVAEAEPLEDDVVASGNNRSLPASIWSEITLDGTTGWASSRFLAYLGDTSDVTSEIVSAHGSIPSAAALEDLTDTVVASRQYTSESLRIVVVQEPQHGDLSEMTVDILGFEDDSVLGERLHVFAQVEDGVYGLKSVEATVVCGRGVTDDLLCV